MKQYNLDDLEAFVKVVELSSFSQAASLLGTSNAAMSRRIGALENALGIKLLNRTTRQLSLTEAGQQFYRDTLTILGALEEAEDKARQGAEVISGHIRLAVPLSFGLQKISPLLPEFLKRYPDLSLHVQLEDSVTDLLADSIDLAIRIGDLKDSSLIASRIGEIERLFCASPDYLAQHGEPQHPNELIKHACLRYSLISSMADWNFTPRKGSEGVQLRGPLSANNGQVLKDAAVQGMGIVMMPHFIVEEAITDGKLKPILEAYAPESIGLYAVMVSRQFVPKKIRLLIEFLRDNLR